MDDDNNCKVILDEETLLSWSKKDLKQWCVDHKKKKSGNKCALVNRILRSVRFDDSSDSSSDSSCDAGLSCVLPEVSLLITNWEPISTSLCPPTRTEDVENYFIYNKNPVTGKSQGCHRQLKKARKFYKERYVSDIFYNGMEDSPYYVKASCKPSMRDVVWVNGKMTHQYTLSVVLVKKTGKIESGACNCKPGKTGLCSHIGGLLLTLAEIRNACTSQGCQWLKPQTALQLQPERLRDIRFASSSEAPVKPYPGTYQSGPCNDPDKFFHDIMSGLGTVNPNCVLYQTMNENKNIKDILDMYEPPFMFHDSVDLNSTTCQSEFQQFTSQIKLNKEEIDQVMESTRGQSSNPLWKEVRTNILTASNFGAICKRRPSTDPDNLLRNLRGYNGVIDTEPLRYGRQKEGHARRDYAREHLKKCGNVTVQMTGVIISEEFPFLGASVDGVVKCAKCGVGALEIKCPFVGRNVTPSEWSGMDSSCVENQNDGTLTLKLNHNYMYQIMGQMKILQVEWCDFVIWTKKGFHVERIPFNSDFWNGHMLFHLKNFYNSFFVAEKFSLRVKRGKKIFG